MIGCTEAFKAAVRGSHRAVSVVELLDDDGDVLAELTVDGGSVEVSRSSAIRRRARVRAIGEDMVPSDLVLGQPGLWVMGGDGDAMGATGDVMGAAETSVVSGAVAPYGTEFRVRRGVIYPDGTDELVPLGVFLLDDIDIVDDANGVTVSLSGFDRAQRVTDARWTEPYVIDAGTNVAEAIQALLEDRYPDVVCDFASTTRVTPLLVLGESTSNDPWADARRLAHDIGHELFFDAEGVCVLQPTPVPTDPSVWSIREGYGGSPTVKFGRRLNRRTTYNAVVVRGENPANGEPVQAIAKDMNPDSPTYWLGTFGQKPKFYSSEYIASEAQAQDVANAMLRDALGLDEAASAEIVPMPALDASDVVDVVRHRSKLNAAFVAESFSVPLGVESTMTVQMRRLRDLMLDEEGGE